ncbi:glycosyltransferase family 4 protein [Ferrovibrio sp.]|uniref:glycosyltransferase family 4 protein n=1 Tax=Ferrovibrio sp. TaxID=1917215 RepID=UPI0025BC835B|nr:glycosyltransferase family 4 protein [Ferrovibrio sp.]MBX3455609.1 glycosyltransferase family 4 protein [Ferrovibrio sp.]
MARRLLIIVHEALFFTSHRLPIGLAMRARGWDVHVAAPADPAVEARLAALGIKMHPIPLARGGMNPLAELKLLAALYRLIRRIDPVLVHHVSLKPVLWGGLASRLARVPAAVHAITGLGFLFTNGEGRADWKTGLLRMMVQQLYRFSLRHRNSLAIFQNPDDLGLFQRLGMVRPDHWRMIKGCGVDMQAFPASPEPTEDPPVAMFPARLLGDKGVNEFVGAAEILRRQGVQARFVLVGRRDPDNPTDIGEPALQNWIKSGLVEYWGYSTDMAASLAKANLIVMPSYREGLPRGLIEAAAIQRAIVTADVPGCREVVRHEQTGLLVRVRDTAATAAAMGRLLQDKAERARMAANGRAMAVAEFSVEFFVAESLKVYGDVLKPIGVEL